MSPHTITTSSYLTPNPKTATEPKPAPPSLVSTPTHLQPVRGIQRLPLIRQRLAQPQQLAQRRPALREARQLPQVAKRQTHVGHTLGRGAGGGRGVVGDELLCVLGGAVRTQGG